MIADIPTKVKTRFPSSKLLLRSGGGKIVPPERSSNYSYPRTLDAILLAPEIINYNFYMEIKLFAATKAFVTYRGKVLILRESTQYKDGSNVGKFDVVGGRITPGQRFDESLLREVREETGLTVKIEKPFYVGEWRPVVRGEQWQIVATFFECSTESDKVTLSEDHAEFQWIDPKDFSQYPLIENLLPAFESYLNR